MSGTGRPAYDADGEPRRRRLGLRGHRAARPGPLARRDAGDRAQGTAAPRRAAADHRRRRAPAHRLCHQHPAGRPGSSARRPRTAPPPPGPRRGPHPLRQGHRAAQTCRCTTWPRTASGAPWSPWPASSPPGHNYSPSPSTQPAAGNPNGSGCGSSPSPDAWPAPPGAPCCTCPPTLPGPGYSSTPSPPCARSPLPTEPAVPVPRSTPQAGLWNRRPPDRPRASCHTRTPQSAPTQPAPTGHEPSRPLRERSGLGDRWTAWCSWRIGPAAGNELGMLMQHRLW